MKWTPRVVAFLVGASSLIQEILWVRLAGFAAAGLPSVFGIVLGLYLIGIAAGAYFGRRLCGSDTVVVRRNGFLVLCVSALFDVLAPFFFLRLIEVLPIVVALMPLVLISAGLKSVLFPIAHHLGSNDALRWKGGSFSKVYFANVVGCTLGPLVVTLWAMDVLPMEQLFLSTGVLTILASTWLCGVRRVIPVAAATILGCFVLVPLLPPLMWDVATVTGGVRPSWLVERKEGVVHTVNDPAGDIVFGGNVYDGRLNVDLHRNSNKIDRVYGVMAAAGNPRRILVVGMSGGSWARVISSFPSVKKIDVVEINPGYLELVRRYPEVSSILDDPRVSIYIADGRRWLRANPQFEYDAIVVNSTFHWRSGATMLLSREFFEIIDAHLAPHGVALVNATGSPEVLKTAADVFEYSFLYGNSVLMSHGDFEPSLRNGDELIFGTSFSSVPAFDREKISDRAAVSRVTSMRLIGLAEVEAAAGRLAEVNTDAAMLTEYRYGEKVR